jgi:phosphoserine aminotransferase
MKKHNFSAGPSILERHVIEQSSRAALEINNSGLSLLEISHRSQDFISIIEEAKALTKELLNISEDYEILFLQGGASLQFYMAALNFSKPNGIAGYIDTGTWSKKAIEESKKIGRTITLASSVDKKYSYIPKNIVNKEKLDYLHFTSNNTIYGTQFHSFQELSQLANINNAKLICDMSSDIFSKEININEFDLIYAGAQKNLGPAGATLVIIKKDSISENKHLPTYLNYNTHIQKKSMFNTPPVFSIYVAMLTLRWLKESGGIKSIERINKEKATLLYNEIDRNPLFFGIVNPEDRSNMNVTFNLKNVDYKYQFETMCEEGGINGIHGHRSIGGYRASIYNALSTESVRFLIQIMKQLEIQHNE